jgi:hypothetical protein
MCVDTACQTTCQSNTTTMGQTLFTAFQNCLIMYCPGAVATDPCSPQNPNYQTTCANCENMVAGPGGQCLASYTACTANLP